MKICFVDTYYPDALKAMPIGNGSYQEELDKVLAWQFGTADFYSREFRKLGWEAIDIIANHPELQEKYWHEHHMNDSQIVQRQIEEFQPDVVWVQDISFWGVDQLKKLAKKCLVVAQLSCAYGNQIQKIEQFHVIFTSFPHYVEKFKNMVYMPLAFCESVLTLPAERVNDVSFVGGLGWQWKYGEKVLEAVAAEIPEARFYGYGFNKLPDSSPLKKKYCGPAWGRDMYRIYQRSKIVINRHGEIAQNYANNMRLYEATGCGAMLVTEHKDNLGDLFGGTVAEYGNADEAVSQIQSALESGSWKEMGQNGQKQTLANHTYAHRVEKINDHIGKL